MKKTILTIFVATSLIASAHEPKISMLNKKQEKISIQPIYNPSKSAGAWFLIGGSSLFVGSISKLLGTYETIPDYSIYKNENDYIKDINKYNNHQRTYNTIFYTSIGISGLTMAIGAFDLLNAPLTETSKTSLKLKANSNTISLCLNFK